MPDLACATRRAVRLSGPILIYGLRILNFAKPASNWFKKNLRGKSWQNSRDKL